MKIKFVNRKIWKYIFVKVREKLNKFNNENLKWCIKFNFEILKLYL